MEPIEVYDKKQQQIFLRKFQVWGKCKEGVKRRALSNTTELDSRLHQLISSLSHGFLIGKKGPYLL